MTFSTGKRLSLIPTNFWNWDYIIFGLEREPWTSNTLARGIEDHLLAPLQQLIRNFVLITRRHAGMNDTNNGQRRSAAFRSLSRNREIEDSSMNFPNRKHERKNRSTGRVPVVTPMVCRANEPLVLVTTTTSPRAAHPPPSPARG